MKFYCLQVEFYADGKVKACVTTSDKRGHSQHRQVPDMTAFKLWWTQENYAKQLLESVKSGEVGEDDILTIYSEFKEWEDEVWFKGKAA
jgi:hypothetical protein